MDHDGYHDRLLTNLFQQPSEAVQLIVLVERRNPSDVGGRGIRQSVRQSVCLCRRLTDSMWS